MKPLSLLLIGCALLPDLAFSQPPTPGMSLSVPQSSREQAAALQESEARQARDWGLRSEEWLRYRQLMQGPLGLHSPNLDPLTALGIEARDEAERNRYAELQVKTEARRVEKMLAYQRAYDAAWQRVFPGLPRVDALGGADEKEHARRAVFVKPDCPPCAAQVRALQASGVSFDLYLIDSRRDDARLRAWARQTGVDPARVRARTITLNHDGGRWQALGLPGGLPAVLREVNGSWQRQ